MREGLSDVGIVGDKAATLDENAQSRTEFVEVGGREHPADGVQVFVCEADATCINLKAKENAARVADGGLGGI